MPRISHTGLGIHDWCLKYQKPTRTYPDKAGVTVMPQIYHIGLSIQDWCLKHHKPTRTYPDEAGVTVIPQISILV